MHRLYQEHAEAIWWVTTGSLVMLVGSMIIVPWLVVRIPRKDLVNFEPDYLKHLADRSVETRGWIKQDRDGLRLTARHPAALDIVTHSPAE